MSLTVNSNVEIEYLRHSNPVEATCDSTQIFQQNTLNSAKNEVEQNKPIDTALESNSEFAGLKPSDAIDKILKKANLNIGDVSETFKQDIIRKYQNKLEFAKNNGKIISDTELVTSMSNYIRGMQRRSELSKFKNQYERDANSDIKSSLNELGISSKDDLQKLVSKGEITQEDADKFLQILNDDSVESSEDVSSLKIKLSNVKSAMESGDMKKFIEAYHQLAREDIETFDQNMDGKIDINEIVAMEEKETGRNLTAEERKQVQDMALNRIAILDQNEDDLLDENEIAALNWATSKINDGANGKTADDITYSEWKTTQEAMSILDFSDHTQDEANKYNKFKQALKNGYEGLKQ